MSSARASLPAAALLLLWGRAAFAAGTPSVYAGTPGTRTVYLLTVNGNTLVGRTRKPMAVYKNITYTVRGLITEEIIEASPDSGLLVKLSFESRGLSAKLAGVETGLFEFLARPFMPGPDQPVTLRLASRGGVSELRMSSAGYSARLAAAFMAAALRPPLPAGGLNAGAAWKGRLPSRPGVSAELEGFFLNISLKSARPNPAWWEIDENAGSLSVRVQDSEEGSPAHFKAWGRVRMEGDLKPTWAHFRTQLIRTGPEAAPPENCDILLEVKQP